MSRQRYFIETWGCQMNELDSQRMAGQLMQHGYLPTRHAEEADLILLNSCSIREKAEHKVFSRLGQYRQFKQNRDMLIGLCGCVAQQAGEDALQRVPELDFVLSPARVGELGQIIERCRRGERVTATGFDSEARYEFENIARHADFKGMVTIIEGCDKNCTFCVVPMTRGPERCRPLDEILAEVRHLVDHGFAEIELLGQTVNHWRDPQGREDFADLLDAVARIEGVHRLRFVTSYPRDFTLRMVRQFGLHSNICPYLHIPVQSGADTVLRRMGRGYTRGEYLELVAALRRERPEIALSTDIIVGFPGETAAEFADTLHLVEGVRFASIYAFAFSPRPGTAALRLPDAVDPGVAAERLQRLLSTQQEIQTELNGHLVGRTMEVLVTARTPQGGFSGRTSCHRVVHFPAATPQPLGSLLPVRIERANPHSLIGSSAA